MHNAYSYYVLKKYSILQYSEHVKSVTTQACHSHDLKAG